MAYVMTTTQTYGDVIYNCVACGADKIDFWRQKDYQFTEGSTAKVFHIYRCKSCGTGFLNQPPHRQWLKSIYQYSGQALTQAISLDEVLVREVEFPNCTVDAQRMAQQADELNKSGNYRALDIGSGFGFYTRGLRRLGYRTVSINPGEYENQVFKDLNGDEPLPIMFEDYQSEQKFGVVVMSQVLEHLLEPDVAVAKVVGLLESGGLLACAVPNYASFLVKLLGTRDNACLWVPEHVNYFTKQGLVSLLERNGLRVLKTEQISRVPTNAVSRRLGLKGSLAAVIDAAVGLAQLPFTGLMNVLGLGIYITVYAEKI